MSQIKGDTYCANCHWQYYLHFGQDVECPNPEGLRYETPQSYFTADIPIHGGAGAPEAVEAMDASEEFFDVSYRAQKRGIACIIMLCIISSMMIGIYIGHFVWLQ